MSTGYQVYDQAGCYFLTFQVTQWADVFSRKIYRDIIIESLKYCIENKGLRLHAYVIMTNHLHLIASSRQNNLSAIIRDFKRHTSKEIIAAVIREPESRREWLLKIFKESAGQHARNEVFQLWTHENHAIELYSAKFIKQKIDYIHENPVRAGIVEKEEDYTYSSAKEYFTGTKGLVSIDLLT
jgi:REP element-mobilizing transposase RayT